MPDTALDARLAALTDQQVLTILRSLVGEFADDSTPERRDEQLEALQSALDSAGEPVSIAGAQGAAPPDAASVAAARELLALLAQVPEVRPSLEDWLADPPAQETAAVPLIVVAPLVFTGCIVLLQVAAQTRVHRTPDGKWEIDLDPTKDTALGRSMKDLVSTIGRLVGAFVPGGNAGGGSAGGAAPGGAAPGGAAPGGGADG